MEKTVGKNDPCPCGSGKKYQYCCGSSGVMSSQPGRKTLTNRQLEILYTGLESLADAVKDGKGNLTDEKLNAILEYIGLERNDEVIRETKNCVRIFKDVFNKRGNDRQLNVAKITTLGIPLDLAEPVVDILCGPKPQKPLAIKQQSNYYMTNAGRFLLDMTIDDLPKVRELLKRFDKGNSLNKNELEYLLKTDFLDEFFAQKET